ncbi:MAG: magnesium transporter CorA family protein [Candidatus Aenigmatarchaeota archaeon]
MIKIYYKSIGDEEIKLIEKPIPGCWIDIVKPTKEEVIDIAEKLSIPKEFVASALDENERPRCDKENGISLIIFRVPVVDVADPISKIETAPITIIITNELILTISLKETEIFNDFYQNKVKRFYTTKKTRFLLQILSRINRSFMSHLDSIEKKIEEVEDSLLRAVKNEDIIRLFGLEKTLIYFNAAVIGNGNVLEAIMKGRVVKLFESDEELLENLIIENKQSIEMVQVFSNILSNTMDAYTSIVSNNLNIVMKILASLTVIIALPTLIASFYGMNVSLPLEEDPNAFVVISLISLLISFVVSLVFIKKKWL